MADLRETLSILDHLGGLLADLEEAILLLENINNSLHKKKVYDINKRLKKTNSSVFSLNTFEINEHYFGPEDGRREICSKEETGIAELDKKINVFSRKMIKLQRLFIGNDIRFIDEKLDRTHSLLSIECSMVKRSSQIKNYMSEIKKAYNRAVTKKIPNHPDDKRHYIVNLKVSPTKNESQEAFIKRLTHSNAFKTKHNELLRSMEESEANLTLWKEVISAYKEKNQNNRSCTDEQINQIIREEIKSKNSIYIHISYKNKKHFRKAIPHYATYIATLATLGQAFTSAYAISLALLSSQAVNSLGLLAALLSNPTALALTIFVILSALMVNQCLFEEVSKNFLIMVFNGQMFKKNDGSDKTIKEKSLLGFGLFVAITSAATMSVLIFNSCQSALSGLLTTSPTSTGILIISTLVALATFIALSAFIFPFLKTACSNLDKFKTQLGRTFFRGRCKTGKIFLLIFSILAILLFVAGTILMGGTSLTKFFQNLGVFNSSGVLCNALNASQAIISIPCYIFIALDIVSRSIQSFRSKTTAIVHFFKHATTAQAAGRIGAMTLCFILNIVFFLFSCAFTSGRLILNALRLSAMLATALLTPLSIIVIGLFSISNNKSFITVFKEYITITQQLSNKLSESKACRILGKADRYCSKRGTFLAAFLNALAIGALQHNSINAASKVLPASLQQPVSSALSAPTIAVGGGVSLYTRNEALKNAIFRDELKESISKTNTIEHEKQDQQPKNAGQYLQSFFRSNSVETMRNDLHHLVNARIPSA